MTRRLLIVLLLALPFVGMAKINDAQQRRLTYYYLAAQSQKAKGNLTAMTELLQHCLRIDPENPAATYDMALVYFSLDQDSLGMRALRKAVKNDPKNPWYLESLASAYLSMRQQDAAVPVLEQLSQLQTKRTDVLTQLFQLYKSKGRTQDAINALDRIQTLQGNSTRIAAQKYALYMDQQDTLKAMATLSSLSQEFPYDATSLLMLGDTYLGMQQPDSAQAIYDQVERIDPKNIMLQASRMQYELQKGDTVRFRAMRDSVILDDKADQTLRINALGSLAREALQDTARYRQHADSIFAVILSPAKPPVSFLQLYMSYRTYAYHEGNEQMIPIMQRILEIDPSDMETLQSMVQYYISKNDAEQIATLCQKAIIYHPSELVFHYFLGVALAQQKKNKEAIDALTTAIRQKTDESRPEMVGEVYALLGDIYHEQGNEKASFAAYDSCLVYMPDNAACLNNYAYFLSLKEDQLSRAEEMSYHAIKAEPNNKTYLDTYAWVLFQQGDYATARIYMDRVVSTTLPDSAIVADTTLTSIVLEHAGDIQAKNGKTDEAVRFWQFALQKPEPNAILKKKIKKREYIKAKSKK